ncbi:MAG: glycosyltransferase family 39 protein [Planctomycetes bacterium]|nr:glycosyltransferase family 39 protein [Planctomycetota bacterium]
MNLPEPKIPDQEKKPGGCRMIWLAAVVLGSVLLHSTYYNCGVKNLIDLGVLAVDSERILEGERFAQDFVAPYGPGRYYLVAGLFSLFGPSLNVLLILFVVLRVAVDLCTFCLAGRLLPKSIALSVTVCTAFAHGPTHKGFLTLGLVLLLLGAARVLEKPSRANGFAMGVLIGLAGLFRYDLGAVGLVLGLLVLFLGLRAEASAKAGRGSFKIAFLIGLILSALPGLALILCSDPLRLMLMELTRAEVLKNAQVVSDTPWKALLSWTAPAGGMLSLLLLASPPLVLLGSILPGRASKGSNTGSHGLLWGLIALSGCLLFTQYAIEPKINRLLQVGPPLFCCLFLIGHGLGARLLPRTLQWVLPALLLGITGGYVYSESGYGSIDSPAVLLHPQERVQTAHGNFSAPPVLARGLKASLAWVERNVEEGTFYASPALALHYFLAGKKNPSPITDFSYLLQNEKAQQWVWEKLGLEEPACYLYRPGIIQGFDPEQEAPYLFSNLKLMFPRYQALAEGYVVFLRK